MSYVGKSRGLLGFMMALILLSFFYAVPVPAGAPAGLIGKTKSAQTESVHTYPDGATSKVATLTSPDDRLPEGAARISLARTMMDEIMAREQQGARTMLLRFLAIVMLVILLMGAICQQLCRRYGYHMIPHWQNINYIHEVDGKKGERFLVYIA